MNRFTILVTAFMMSYCLSAYGQASCYPNKLLHQYLAVQQKRIGFNSVVLITRSGRVLYKEIIGKRSFELNVPLSLNSGFKIASISKSFTAMLILLASHENKLNLNDSRGGSIIGLTANGRGQMITFNKKQA